MSFGNERAFIDHLQDKEKGGRAMKCPLMCIATFHTGYGLGTEETDCLKEECAWWVTDFCICSIKELALELRYTQQRLKDIEAKMPSGQSFVK